MGWTLRGTIPGAAGAGGANFRANLTPGVALSTVGNLLVSRETVGAHTAQAPAVLLSGHSPAAHVTTSAAGSGARPIHAPAATSRTTATMHPTGQTAAAEAVQITYGLTARNGATVATSTGRDAWPNITNAQGRSDGVMATGNGNATGSRIYRARCTYAALTGKDALSVAGVELRYFFNHRTALNRSSRQLFASWSGGTYTSNFTLAALDARTNPVVVDLFALGCTTWAQVNTITADLEFVTELGVVSDGIDLDAIELVVTATRTDTL